MPRPAILRCSRAGRATTARWGRESLVTDLQYIEERLGHHPEAFLEGFRSTYPTCHPSLKHRVQAAAHCVTEAAENGGPLLFAKIGMMQAINRHKPEEFPRCTKPRPQSDR
jgi:hypothetical protein